MRQVKAPTASSEVFAGSPGPEFKLLIAILTTAVRDFCNTTKRSGRGRTELSQASEAKAARVRLRRSSVEARLWIDSERMEPWTFEWVCEHLGLHPESVRRNIRALARSGIYDQEQFRIKDQMMDRVAQRLYEAAA